MATRQTNKKTPPKKSAQTSKPAAQKPAASTAQAQSNSRRQLWSVVLFFLAAFLFLVVLIKGTGESGKGNAWSFMHDTMLGLFGICAVLWPVLLGYVAIMLALDKPVGRISTKVWEIGILIVLIDSAINIFTEQLVWKELWKSGIAFKSGGVSGFPVAGLLNLFGKPGAHILVCLLIVLLLMLVTGTGLLQVFSMIRKPVEKTIEGAAANFERKQQRFDIDVPIDDNDEFDGEPFQPPAEEELSSKKKKLEDAFSTEETIIEDKPVIKIDLPVVPLRKEPFKVVIEELKSAPPPERKHPYPPLTLLDDVPMVHEKEAFDDQTATANLLVKTLASFNVDVKIVGVSRGPTVTRYELQPNTGVRINKIVNLADDIAMSLAAQGVRIEAPIPGKAAVGIEVPNKVVASVKIKEILESSGFASSKSKLTVALGKDIEGKVAMTDLSNMPHLLVAGTTGAGKSVCINSMIISLLYKSTQDEVKLLLIDPKMVEFKVYDGIPHLLVPVVSDVRKATGALAWAVQEMLKRYQLFAQNNVRDLESYNAIARKSKEDDIYPLPRIVIFIDELSDLMMAAPNEVEDSICRLAQMARAAGMHLVIATQRPSADVITGLIKSNVPSRLSLAVKSQIDSRIILDTMGAEKLLGRGDMLFQPIGSNKPRRIQGCYVTDGEIEAVVDFLKNLDNEETTYDEGIMDEIERQAVAEKGKKGAKANDDGEESALDETLIAAIDYVVEAGQASTSMLQRRLSVGYARAGRMIDDMEQRGIVGPYEGSKPRKVLLSKQQWLEMKQNISE